MISAWNNRAKVPVSERIWATLAFLICQTALQAEPLESQSETYEGKQYQSAFANPDDRPDHPNILLIGDSISIGYTIEVRKQLRGIADVYRIKGNGRYATYGVKHINKWLGNRKWDVIHFNWGLWDLCYRNPQSKEQGHRDKVHGTLTTTLTDYERSLRTLVTRLQQTNASLIWCATTPVPSGEAGRKLGDDLRYNAVANHVMKEHDVHINDLHTHARKKLPGIMLKPGDVHFTKAGYKYLATKVADKIKTVLSEPTR